MKKNDFLNNKYKFILNVILNFKLKLTKLLKKIKNVGEILPKN